MVELNKLIVSCILFVAQHCLGCHLAEIIPIEPAAVCTDEGRRYINYYLFSVAAEKR